MGMTTECIKHEKQARKALLHWRDLVREARHLETDPEFEKLLTQQEQRWLEVHRELDGEE
jgi:hypothetical protein